MKNKLVIAIAAASFLLLVGCSSEDPQFRVRNERTNKANVQFQTTGGSTVNINDVTAGQTTGYQTVAEGNAVVTAGIQSESVSPTVSFFCSMDSRYTIVILAGDLPSLRIEN